MKNLRKVLQSFIVIAVAVLTLLSITVTAQAQNYPEKDITFINPFKPGGSTDPLSRAFAKGLEKILKVNVNVINKSGAAGTIGFSELVKSKPRRLYDWVCVQFHNGLPAAPQFLPSI